MAYSEELVDIPGRDPAVGYPIFRAHNHPLAAAATQRVFVMYMDTREFQMKKLWEWEASLEVPYHQEEDLVADGERSTFNEIRSHRYLAKVGSNWVQGTSFSRHV
jgi:hypothetical protein